MGAFTSTLENIVNTILDIVIIKSGIVISEEHLVKLLQEEFPNNDGFANYEREKLFAVRVRSEEFDEYCYRVRKRLGEIDNIVPIFAKDINKLLEWEKKGYDYYGVIHRIFALMEESFDFQNPKPLDPNPILDKVIAENIAPLEVVIEAFKSIVQNQQLSNHINPTDEITWDGGIEIDKLFTQEHIPLNKSDFIDQKFINYLQANPKELEFMHWRNFERLTAEFFKRLGYKTELGPGTNDGGIDIRVFNINNTKSPYIIIQCKRHKKSNEVKIETVKSFYTDIEFENAKKGLIATTSKIASGGKKVVSIRKYPLEFAENKEIVDWVNKMTKRI